MILKFCNFKKGNEFLLDPYCEPLAWFMILILK